MAIHLLHGEGFHRKIEKYRYLALSINGYAEINFSLGS